MPRVLVFAQTSKTKYPVFLTPKSVFDQKLVVIKTDEYADFAVLCSYIHYVWVHARGGKQRTDAVYTPSDVFEPYPFPHSDRERLYEIGSRYDEVRSKLMAENAIGLTDLYNRFHDPLDSATEITEMRALHLVMDKVVRDSYGWADMDLSHGFYPQPYLPENDRIRYTRCEPARLEVLRRLSRLNRERWQAEQDDSAAALHDVEVARKAIAKKRMDGRPTFELVSPPQQTRLF